MPKHVQSIHSLLLFLFWHKLWKKWTHTVKNSFRSDYVALKTSTCTFYLFRPFNSPFLSTLIQHVFTWKSWEQKKWLDLASVYKFIEVLASSTSASISLSARLPAINCIASPLDFENFVFLPLTSTIKIYFWYWIFATLLN